MNNRPNSEYILNLWEGSFPGLDFPEVRFMNAWRMAYAAQEIDYAFDVAIAALQTGRITEPDTERIGRYISATLKKQRQQHQEFEQAIERRRAMNGGAL